MILVFNEVENLRFLYDHLKAVLQKLPYSFEILFMDDGSNDGTYPAIQKLRQVDSRVKANSRF